jgi:hypothetical protein
MPISHIVVVVLTNPVLHFFDLETGDAIPAVESVVTAGIAS